jgi:serine protein kinase
MLNESSLSNAPCAPKTLDILAQFSVLSRLVPSKHSPLEVKMEVYNGESLKHKNIEAKSVYEYRKEAHGSGLDEGFFGQSTRFAFKTLSQTFNHDISELAANPLHLIFILMEKVKQEHLTTEEESKLLLIIQHLSKEYYKFIESEFKIGVLEAYDETGQNVMDRYVTYADSYLNDEDYRDPMSNLLMTPRDLEKFLEEIEAPAGISNVKDFRNEVVKFCLRHRSKNEGRNPKWTSYQKIRDIIEAKLFSNFEDLLPIISNSNQGTTEEKKQHSDFVKRMKEKGYTEKQVHVLVDWYIKTSKD